MWQTAETLCHPLQAKSRATGRLRHRHPCARCLFPLFCPSWLCYQSRSHLWPLDLRKSPSELGRTSVSPSVQWAAWAGPPAVCQAFRVRLGQAGLSQALSPGCCVFPPPCRSAPGTRSAVETSCVCGVTAPKPPPKAATGPSVTTRGTASLGCAVPSRGVGGSFLGAGHSLSYVSPH